MKIADASIRIDVDYTNPGQFFACCGLLELADRLWPGAEGWFEERQFCIDCVGTLQELLCELAKAEIRSSLTDEELKQLASLLSAKKADLAPEQSAEKERLRKKWQRESLYVGKPFQLHLDWWRNEHSERTEMKTWAAKQFVLEIARPLHQALSGIAESELPGDILNHTGSIEGLPFYFDAAVNSQNTPRDTGFGLYALRNIIRTQDAVRPALELLAFLGLQRFRPFVASSGREFRYACWPTPLSPVVAAVAATGALAIPGQAVFAFRLLNRTKYMKAFLPARPV